MAQTTNAGRDFFIYLLTMSSTVDTPFQITTGYTPNGTGATPPGPLALAQTMNANTIVIQCRSAIDLQLRKVANDANFFTIKSGTVFEFKLNPSNTQNLFWLRSASSTPTAEILIYTE